MVNATYYGPTSPKSHLSLSNQAWCLRSAQNLSFFQALMDVGTHRLHFLTEYSLSFIQQKKAVQWKCFCKCTNKGSGQESPRGFEDGRSGPVSAEQVCGLLLERLRDGCRGFTEVEEDQAALSHVWAGIGLRGNQISDLFSLTKFQLFAPTSNQRSVRVAP